MAIIGPGYLSPSPFSRLGQAAVGSFATAPQVPTSPGYAGSAPTTGGGYVPPYQAPAVDYGALLQSLIAPLQAQSAGMTAADQAGLKAAQQRAIIQFGTSLGGADPNLVGAGFANAINQKTLGLAQKNTAAGLSISARLAQAHQDQVNAIQNSLAARGLLHSGETGFQMGREQTASTQAQYDARQKILDYLSGIQSAFQSAEQQRQWALAMAAMQSAQSMPFYPPQQQPYYGGGPAQESAAQQAAPATGPNAGYGAGATPFLGGLGYR